MTGELIWACIVLAVIFAAIDEAFTRYRYKKQQQAWAVLCGHDFADDKKVKKFYTEQGHKRQCADE